jgi:hypothetical protein
MSLDLLIWLAVMVFLGTAILGISLVMETMYNRLFGLLYRHVSKEYAEPVSFWITMLLPVSFYGGLFIAILTLTSDNPILRPKDCRAARKEWLSGTGKRPGNSCCMLLFFIRAGTNERPIFVA